MSWSTGYTKIIRQIEHFQATVAYVESLGLKLGSMALHNGEIKKISQLWISDDDHKNITIEFEHEEGSHPMKYVKWGKEIDILFQQRSIK